MIKVTLLGDSIRLFGYGKRVEELLGENYEVFQSKDNDRYSKFTLRELSEFQKEMEGSDIVHWNNGLWDVSECLGDGAFTDIDEYIKNMTRIAKILKERYKTVIFATTTPVKNSDDLLMPRIRMYNEKLTKELEKMGVFIDDLYPVILENIEENIRGDNIHLTEAGSEKAAWQVVKSIKEAEKYLK